MQTLNLVYAIPHAVEELVEAVFFHHFARGAEDEERVGGDVVFDLCVGM